MHPEPGSYHVKTAQFKAQLVPATTPAARRLETVRLLVARATPPNGTRSPTSELDRSGMVTGIVQLFFTRPAGAIASCPSTPVPT
jgi:hypothetical protein